MQLYIYNGQVTTYYITETGELFNAKTNKWLKGQINYKNGYKSYSITIDGEMHRVYAHRMVAEVYLSRIEGKNEVNHKDGNKLNNCVSNLEWVTSKENKAHGVSLGLYSNNQTKVYCFDENKRLVCAYASVADVCRINHYNSSWINEQLNREVKTLSHGFYWSRTPSNDFKTKKVTPYPAAKKVGQYDANNTLIEQFHSLTDAQRKTGYDRHRISECCNGKIKTYKGYIWKFIE